MKPEELIKAANKKFAYSAFYSFDKEDNVFLIEHLSEHIVAHGDTIEEAEELFSAMLESMEEAKAEGK